jgi:hypothetical protein
MEYRGEANDIYVGPHAGIRTEISARAAKGLRAE